jgi:hypothetical protein
MVAEMHFYSRRMAYLFISFTLTGQHLNKITVEAWNFASRIEFYMSCMCWLLCWLDVFDT